MIKDYMNKDFLDVEFSAVVAINNNCTCDACHGISKVLKITLPETRYHNLRELTTKDNEYWLCDHCRTKLARVLNFQIYEEETK